MQTNMIISILDKIIKYLEPLLPLANCHMVDFFTQNLYQSHVPSEIQVEDDGNILDAVWKASAIYPKLHTFILSCENHTVFHFNEICLNLNELQYKLINLGCDRLSGFHLESFMSSKKSHEVEIMSKIVSAVNCITNTNHVVDIGDGKGYLSSALAMHSGAKVLGVDSSAVNTVGAAIRVRKLRKAFKQKDNVISYKQITKFITENNTNMKDLVDEYFSGSSCDSISLVGLHTCGDLAPTCLKIFHSDHNVKSICNVGCCYHLLSENLTDGGFPLSTYLKNVICFSLGRNARMLAAQSLDRIIQNREIPSKVLMYRAVLQVLLMKHAPEYLDCKVGRLRHDVTFVEYVRNALIKFKCDICVSDYEILQLYEEYETSLAKLQFFYLIRAHLAPVIESVILLDRLLFLQENGYVNSFLVRLFDPVISPRCYGIIAFK